MAEDSKGQGLAWLLAGLGIGALVGILYAVPRQNSIGLCFHSLPASTSRAIQAALNRQDIETSIQFLGQMEFWRGTAFRNLTANHYRGHLGNRHIRAEDMLSACRRPLSARIY